MSVEALFTACRRGDLAEVERLLAAGVDPAARDNLAIMDAASNGRLGVVNRLLQEERVDPAAVDNDAIYAAAYHGHLGVVDRLLRDERVDPADRDNRVIRIAADHGHCDIVRRLLEDGRVDPTAHGNDAIWSAATSGHHAVVGLLLEDGRVDPSTRFSSALSNAAIGDCFAVVDLLLSDGRADPAGDCGPPGASNHIIGSVAGNGNLKMVKRLLEDIRTGVPPRALHNAARGGHPMVLNLLLNDYRVVAKEVDVEELEEAAAKGGAEVQEVVRRWRAEVQR